MASLVCDIVTPEKKEYSAECYMVTVPGESGSMGFLPGHAPLMSTLSDGEVHVLSSADVVAARFVCQGGYVQVTGEKVIVLPDRAMAVDEINMTDVNEKKAALQAEMAALEEGSLDYKSLAYDLRWYEVLEHAVANS